LNETTEGLHTIWQGRLFQTVTTRFSNEFNSRPVLQNDLVSFIGCTKMLLVWPCRWVETA